MYASLTLLHRRIISSPSTWLSLALAVVGFSLAGCGTDTPEQVVIYVTATPDASAPTATVAPTATLVPTVAPTATTTPYWAKGFLPGIAMEQYPPLNTRTDYELRNTQEWLNGDPTTIEALRESGEVVLVDFWTYT